MIDIDSLRLVENLETLDDNFVIDGRGLDRSRKDGRDGAPTWCKQGPNQTVVSMDSGIASACAAPIRAGGMGLSISHTGMACR